MNDAHALTVKNLIATLPKALREDEQIYALATIAAEKLVERQREIDTIRIFSQIDTLPEELLDILAYDFKVDWWDHRYTLEQKRQTLKDSFLVHRRLGTKYAVETALSGVYPNSKVQEWFEYGGEPYTFRLLVNTSGQAMSLDLHKRAFELVNYYKNLRSHLRGVEFTVEAKEDAVIHVGGRFSTVVSMPLPELSDELEFRQEIHVSGRFSGAVRMAIPEVPDEIQFEERMSIGTSGAAIAKIPIPMQADKLEFRRETYIGGGFAGAVRLGVPEVRDKIHLEERSRIGTDAAVVTTLYLPEL